MQTGNDSDNGFKEIKPTPFNRAAETSVTQGTTKSISLKSLNITLGLAVMLVSLILVIFFLPDWVNNNQTTSTNKPVNHAGIDTTPKPPVTIKPPSANQTVTEQLSPEDQAKHIALRKEAQNYLQEILEKQNKLEENNAQIWAAEGYVTGLNHAKSGDTFYNQQQFAEAKQEYEQALTSFNRLYEQIDAIYQENIDHGLNALDNGDSESALTAFKTASLFTDESQQAAKGLERAQKLGNVFANIERGDEALSEERLTDAKTAYQTALELDPETKLAKQKLKETNQLLADKQFNAYMSTGYAALDKKNFVTALNQFNKALKIKPNTAAAKTALQQTRHQATTLDIANTLKQAAASEANENWQTAIDLYDNALKLEKNLAKAQAGKQRAQRQLAINQRLEQILSSPERLSDKKIHAQTTTYFNDISKTGLQGPILTRQLTDLENLLLVSATPVKIQLQSDNLTDVVVYKVGKMGLFATKELSLRPGKYIAVGKRDGYRDVRVEFLVSQDNRQQTIRIAANEKI